MNIYGPISEALGIPSIQISYDFSDIIHDKHVSPWNKGISTGKKGIKRPNQKIIATKRNNMYWSKKGRPIREFNCPNCNKFIKTRRPEQKACSKSCGAFLQHARMKCESVLFQGGTHTH